MNYKMHGVIPPMITPFTKEGAVDEAQLRTLLRFLQDKVHGVFVCGSYGSGPLMSVAEKKRVIEIAMEERGALQVVAMTGCITTDETIELTKFAAAAGVDAASAVAPYYYHYGEADIIAYYQDVLDAIGSTIPFYIYSNPKFSGYPVELKTLRKLKEIGVAGCKAASFDIMEFANMIREFEGEDFDVALGTEALWLPAYTYGAQAFIPGLANAFPEICRKMYDESQRGDLEACRNTQFKINKIRDIMYLAGSTQLAIYTMLDLRGIIHAYPRKPFHTATPEQKEDIRKALAELGML